jgi:CTP:molybdopterin cytidylyltransferase MocA
MTHSLRLANATIDSSDAILVLLADMPDVTRDLVDRVLAAGAGHDIAYPIRDGVGGHPVYFAATARAGIAALPDGDTLKALRDAPGYVVARLETADPGAYRDIDTPDHAANPGPTITQ